MISLFQDLPTEDLLAWGPLGAVVVLGGMAFKYLSSRDKRSSEEHAGYQEALQDLSTKFDNALARRDREFGVLVREFRQVTRALDRIEAHLKAARTHTRESSKTGI